MKSFLYRAFWKQHKKWLVLFSSFSIFLFVLAYLAWDVYGKNICGVRAPFAEITDYHQSCVNFYLYTIYNPFFTGAFLKVVIIAPLLLLSFSNLVFKTWLIFSVVVLPYAAYQIVTAPTHAMFFDKVATSGVWGLVYLIGTVAIIVFASIGEWAYKQYKKK